MKRKPLSEELKQRLSAIKKGKTPKNFIEMQKKAWLKNKERIGDKNNKWKGDLVGYGGLHDWIRAKLGTPDKCEICKKSGLTGKKIHWANKSKKYKRDIKDWIRMCVACHANFDKRYLKRKRDKNGRFI